MQSFAVFGIFSEKWKVTIGIYFTILGFRCSDSQEGFKVRNFKFCPKKKLVRHYALHECRSQNLVKKRKVTLKKDTVFGELYQIASLIKYFDSVQTDVVGITVRAEYTKLEDNC